ncbi:hypothetical protein QS1_1480 [Clostridioides difficile P11]|uniref:FeoB-associated Cys-rich membrane protein n=1 Tax=Clostridioides difficile TaxID=1496 RepID=UPI00038CEAFD|nr:FeoB-associated Cys-rich membrane protein [Clostridioides difficile]EQJ23756.1 hypothetical protein QS1_1480 [Clostridioides difficile P11]
MLTYLMKRQMHKKDDGMSKPMMITGAVITGVGAYAVYKMVKSHKSNSQMVNTNYYGNSDYMIINMTNLIMTVIVETQNKIMNMKN